MPYKNIEDKKARDRASYKRQCEFGMARHLTDKARAYQREYQRKHRSPHQLEAKRAHNKEYYLRNRSPKRLTINAARNAAGLCKNCENLIDISQSDNRCKFCIDVSNRVYKRDYYMRQSCDPPANPIGDKIIADWLLRSPPKDAFQALSIARF